MKAICENEDAVFNYYKWVSLGMDDDTSSDNMELLNHIVSLWLTIRGYSISKCWMERYKQMEAKSTKNVKGLRKELIKSVHT